MKKHFLIITTCLLVSALLFSSCAGQKDCQGKRHRIKTEMGGYL